MECPICGAKGRLKEYAYMKPKEARMLKAQKIYLENKSAKEQKEIIMIAMNKLNISEKTFRNYIKPLKEKENG